VKLQNEFTVAAPLERTWTTLLDVERVASCLPGASIEPVGEDGMYRGSMRLKAGPVSLSYSGTVRLADIDVDEHVASFDARARESKGTGTAAAMIRNRLEPAGDGTRVVVETDLNVTGRPAQFGRGLMEDVASKILGDFAGRLEDLVLQGATVTADSPPRDDALPRTEDETRLDVGGVLLSGYRRELAAAGGLLALLLFLLLGRRRKGIEVTVRYRV
jgi:carbon monoxide dehydrogenase subunit G